MVLRFTLAILLVLLASPLARASDGPSIGIGPVTSVTLGPIAPKLAAQGKQLFEAKCSACHKLDERYVGPSIRGVTGRRAPEWIMNWILNSEAMVKEDPVAQAMLEQFLVAMPNQNVTEADARHLLEYFRQVDTPAPAKTRPAGKKK
jgi:cytochrome c551/c552